VPPENGDSMKQFFFNKVIGRVAVFALSDDPATQHELESKAVALLKKIGFDAAEGHPQIPNAGQYSADDLARLLRNAGFRSIAEARPKADPSKDISVSLHTLDDPVRAHYSKTRETIARALGIFIQALMIQEVLRVQ
jgi:hypothetical protein